MKTWTKEEIVELLKTNDKMVCRSTVKIFERQTADERSSDATSHNNGIGFNGTDAFIMSKFAKFYIEKNYLTEKQLVIARKKILKYAGQLARIANEESKPEAVAKPSIPVEPKITANVGFEVCKDHLMCMMSVKFRTFEEARKWAIAMFDEHEYDMAEYEHDDGPEAMKEAMEIYSNYEHDRRMLAIEQG